LGPFPFHVEEGDAPLELMEAGRSAPCEPSELGRATNGNAPTRHSRGQVG
jgi:hypothetical protein